MKPKATPVFPPNIKPVRPGVYRVKIKRRGWCWARWMRGIWRTACAEIEWAKKEKIRSFALYGPNFIGWQGLAEKP